MRENRIRANWDRGQAVLSGWLSIGSAFGAEVMAAQPFDAVTVDLQHGMIDIAAAIGMIQAISTKAPTPMVRAPWNDPPAIMKLLDAGALGVICPMVNSGDECARFVSACRYEPEGARSFGPTRAALHLGADYFEQANRSVVTLAMVETRAAVAAIDEIVAVDGLDGVFIGPSDLAISLGHAPTMEPTAKELVDAIETIKAAAHKRKRKAGIFCIAGRVARRWFEAGFDFVAIGSDVRFIANGAQAEIKAARG